MTSIYPDFQPLADRFDTLLVDAYGVFWGGRTAIPGSLECLAAMVKSGKRVCILSNTSVLADPSIKSYARKGVVQGVHYTDIVTSGDVFYHHLMTDDLPSPGHNLYPIGAMRWSWQDIPLFHLTEKLNEADMIFFGTPQIFQAELSRHPAYRNICFPTLSDPTCFNTTDPAPFMKDLERLAVTGLPAVSTNPDLVALENGHWVIRQGTFAEIYRRLGGLVFEFGKPYANIYTYAFQKLGITPNKRVAMIGDTFRTDIRGALDAGITPVWCLDYGVARFEEEHGRSLEEQAGGSLDDILLIHHL